MHLAMTDSDKTAMLSRLFDGDPYVGAELRAKVRNRIASRCRCTPIGARTVGELRARANAIGLAREEAAAEKLAAERQTARERGRESPPVQTIGDSAAG